MRPLSCIVCFSALVDAVDDVPVFTAVLGNEDPGSIQLLVVIAHAVCGEIYSQLVFDIYGEAVVAVTNVVGSALFRKFIICNTFKLIESRVDRIHGVAAEDIAVVIAVFQNVGS